TKINNRKLLQGILEFVGVPTDRTMTIMLSIDKLEKIGIEGVVAELEEKKLAHDVIDRAMKILGYKGTNTEILNALKQEISNERAQEGIKELQELLTYTEVIGVDNVQVDISLARGLEMYTGNVFEVYLKSEEFSSSLAGGGRYDKMIGEFFEFREEGEIESERNIEVPAVGISFGLDTVTDALVIQRKMRYEETVTKVFVIPIRPKKLQDETIDENMKLEAIKVVSQFRKERIPTDIDLVGRSISKNLEYANKKGIAYVILIGPKEYAQQKIRLRNMKSGEEDLLTLEEACNKLISVFR
ncbi:MAG: His/Gly/Thr/Pro-type tRNA ligase C-terminal domain-containing protein, partial [Candidatus Hodarchaeota archaeon]